MRVSNFIITSLFASIFIGCSHKPKEEPEKVVVQSVTLRDYHIDDEIEPPPDQLTSNFSTLQQWLVNICHGRKPTQSIAHYEFGLFESTDDYTIFLIGINEYRKEDTSYTRIEFKPTNMYFPLPKHEYNTFSRDKLIARLISQLKGFTDTETFKNSFFTKADEITFATNGQKIWKKEQ